MEWRRYKEALKEAENALRDNPEDPDLFALIGRIYFMQNEHEKALHWANEALKREPEQQVAWYVRVGVYYETNQEQAFQEAIREAVRIDPYESLYPFMKATRLLKKGQIGEARVQLLRALELVPVSSLYLAALSYVEALRGNDAESRRLDRQAVQYEAENPHALLYLAWAANRRGEFGLQEAYMKNAVRLHPEDKQFQDEYLEALQHNQPLFRLVLLPVRLIRKLKPWQIFLGWLAAALLFKPLLVVFIVLYVAAHWLTKGIVHVRVFGWRRRGS
ncbi:MAG: tetratricopeptide repeat protein [Paenibacillaceae bacterium]|nr:tetratricopeptide repeat protein [Paenibacillaceae bacterium]